MVEESEFAFQFKKDVEWLHKNVPPDDVYVFAHQALLAAEYFLWRWSEWANVIEEAKKDSMADLWIQNIVGMKMLRKKGETLDHRD